MLHMTLQSLLSSIQHLLHVRAFPGHDTAADWILSLTAINAPLNGSLAAYALGEREDRAPDVIPMSPGSLLGSIVHIFAFLDFKIFGFDLGMDHWNLSWRGSKQKQAASQKRTWTKGFTDGLQAIRTLMSSLFTKSQIVASEDNAAYDSSLHGMAKCNALVGAAHDCTFYISLVGDAEDGHRRPPAPARNEWRMHLAWIICSLQCFFRRSVLAIIAHATRRQRYEVLANSLKHVEGFEIGLFSGASDGLVSVFSQSHPCVGVKCEAWRVRDMPEAVGDMQRGAWHVQRHSHDHMGLIPFPASADGQRRTFQELFERLRSLPLVARLKPYDLTSDCYSAGHSVADVGRTSSEASEADTEETSSSDNLVMLESRWIAFSR